MSRWPLNSIRFDDKPSEEVRTLLKAWGFHYRHGAWNAPRSIESAVVIDCIRQGDTDPASVAERVAVSRMEADCGII